jgi:hypothetical protein
MGGSLDGSSGTNRATTSGNGLNGTKLNRGNSKPNYLKNCIKIEMERSTNILVCRKDIIDGLIPFINNAQVIERITQYLNNRTWFIQFKETFDSEKLHNEEITILNHKTIIQPPNQKLDKARNLGKQGGQKYVYHCFKVMWNKPSCPLDSVIDHLCGKEGKFISMKEIISNDEYKIGTGIYNITISYDANNSISFKERTGKQIINNEKYFITRYGDEVICLFCNEYGHVKADCKLFNTRCLTCNNRGHSKCTMATMINKNNNEAIAELDEDHELAQASTQPITVTTSEITTNTSNLFFIGKPSDKLNSNLRKGKINKKVSTPSQSNNKETDNEDQNQTKKRLNRSDDSFNDIFAKRNSAKSTYLSDSSSSDEEVSMEDIEEAADEIEKRLFSNPSENATEEPDQQKPNPSKALTEPDLN